jgi:poly-gamma-glutamate synthesis protein (capsule biosynthesis protein)
MVLDRQGARSLETHPVRIDMDGVPHPDPDTPSPCWQRGDAAIGSCLAARR